MSNQSQLSQSINDQYFTPDISAAFCVQKMRDHGWMDGAITALEPAAGKGALVDALDGITVTSYDIEDFGIGANIHNFLEVAAYGDPFDLVFSNPPFGRAGSIANKFLNHAAKFSNRLGFILPQSFRKISAINKINPRLHPVGNYDLPDQLFVLPTGERRKVLTCFIMWEKREINRPQFEFSYHDYFKRTTPEEAEYAFRTQGASAGTILDGLYDKKLDGFYSPSSTAYLKGNRDRIAKHDFTPIARMTAGIPAIGLHDVAGVLWLEDRGLDPTEYLKHGALSLLTHPDYK